MNALLPISLLIGPLLALVLAVLWMIPNVLVIGEPGSGKSVGTAAAALAFSGSVVILDPHKDSLAKLVLEHAEGNVLIDRISDLDHPLRYGLLRPSTHSDPLKRAQENQRLAKLFVEVMMRRRGGEIAGSPLMEEWIMALLMLFLYQGRAKSPDVIPFGFMPGTATFRALLRDCTLPEIRHKFEQLEKLNPRALRAEVGSALRLVEGVFRNREFLVRCGGGEEITKFLQAGGKLIVERGDADEDVTRIVMGGISQLVTQHCESRARPFPPMAIGLDECTNARTAGTFEEKKAGETRKYGLNWWFICQHPNFPNPEGFFQNCQEKHFYRTGDYTLAHKLAAFVASALPRDGETRASMIDSITTRLMNFKPGWRYVIGPRGAREEYVPMLKSPWPDWPGLREAKLREKLQWIYQRPEYRTPVTPSSGDDDTPDSSTSPDDTPSSASSSQPSSPAERWKRDGRKLLGGS